MLKYELKEALGEVLKEFSKDINQPIRQVTIPLSEYDEYRYKEKEYTCMINDRNLIKSKLKYFFDNRNICDKQYLIALIEYINERI